MSRESIEILQMMKEFREKQADEMLKRLRGEE